MVLIFKDTTNGLAKFIVYLTSLQMKTSDDFKRFKYSLFSNQKSTP